MRMFATIFLCVATILYIMIMHKFCTNYYSTYHAGIYMYESTVHLMKCLESDVMWYKASYSSIR